MNTMFENYCTLHGFQAVPASPTTISRFINGIAELGVERVWAEIQSISRKHYTIGLPDPTLGAGLVTSAINAISKIDPPRSWPREQSARFLSLPYDIQRQIIVRETERDKAVRKAQNEAADLRKQIKELELENGTKADTIVTAAA
jgi:hypothetical protein